MLKVREYRKISGSLEPHSPILGGKTTASGVSNFVSKQNKKRFRRNSTIGFHWRSSPWGAFRRPPRRRASYSVHSQPTNTDFGELQHLSNGGARPDGERERGRGVRALVMCGMESLFPPRSLPLCRSTKSGRITYFQQLTAAELSSSAAAAACTSTLEAENHSQFTAAGTAAIKAIKRGDGREGGSGQPF